MSLEVQIDSEQHATTVIATGESRSLPEAVAVPLLDLLATDDAFRARFEHSPRAALRELGYETPAGDMGVPGADPVLHLMYFHGGLASKARIAAGRELWLAQLRDKHRAFFPFNLCAC